MKKRITSLLLALIFCLGCFTACSSEEKPAEDTTKAPDVTKPTESVIYVDASAADSGDGSENAPFKTVAEAQAKIREIKADGLLDGGVTVLLADGNYQPIAFTEEDSGSENSPIRYVSAEPNGATITGGITLSAADFEAITDDEKAKIIDDAAKEAVIKVDLSKYGITQEDLGSSAYSNYSSAARRDSGAVNGFAELFINTDRMTLARYPNDGFSKTGETDGIVTFAIKDDVKERAVNWDIDTIILGGYLGQEWSYYTYSVANIDFENLTLTVGEEDNYGIRKNHRYFIFNAFSETDMPGEYYIDRENLILYVYPTEDFDTASITLSVSDKDLIKIENASCLSFEGLNISASRTNGFMINGNNINISNCNIFGIRAHAIESHGTDIKIDNNEIYNIGDYAILMYGGEAETLTSSNNLIHNNNIYEWGQLARTASRAARVYGCGTVISHNEVHDAPHQAIQYEGPNHIIEYNEVYNVCLETSDCGAIYSYRSLKDYGSIIRYNFIHDIGVGNALALGIYMDDAESGQTIIGNVIARVTGHGINIGGGRDMVVENNLIIDWNYKSCSSLLYDDRGQGDMHEDKEQAARMGAGVISMQKQQAWLDAFPGYADIIPFTVDYDGDLDDPMLSGSPGNSIVRNNMSYKMKKTAYAGENDPNYTYHNIIPDPDVYFKVCENNLSIKGYEYNDMPGYADGDCTLTEDSQAYQNGFEKLPFDQMGRITEE